MPWALDGRMRLLSLVAWTAAIAIIISGCTLPFGQGAVAPRATVQLTPPPSVLPPAESIGAGALLGGATYTITDPNADWGIGYLTPRNGVMTTAELPLFSSPGVGHWGWLTRGRAYAFDTRVAAPPRPDAWLQLVNGDQALIVLETRSYGWVKVRWGQPDDLRGGVAWTRRDYSRGQRMGFVRWSDEFAGRGGLVFRNRTMQYNLRSQPGVSGDILGVVTGRNYDMEVVRRAGDWLSVRVHEPAQCAPPADGAGTGASLLGGPADDDASLIPGVSTNSAPTRVRTGWVRWRDDNKGPWLSRAWPCLRGSVG